MIITGMRIFASILVLITGVFLLSACSRKNDGKQAIVIGLDEDYKFKDYYEGPGWGGMSRFMYSFDDTVNGGPVKLTFVADKSSLLLATQRCSIWIAGQYIPLDTNWDSFSWNLRVSTKVPIEVVLWGFQNTNGYKTNEDGMVFDCQAGVTNVVLTNRLIWVFNRETNNWRK